MRAVVMFAVGGASETMEAELQMAGCGSCSAKTILSFIESSRQATDEQ